MSFSVVGGLFLGAGAALVGGVFLAFSDFVMRGLVLAESVAGIDAMQRINKTVLRSVFLTVFLAMVPGTIAMAVYAIFRISGSTQLLFVLGAAIYCVAVFAVTVFANVPMNNRLDAMALSGPDAEAYWDTYARIWTRWNHLRTAGSWAAAACFLFAAVQTN